MEERFRGISRLDTVNRARLFFQTRDERRDNTTERKLLARSGGRKKKGRTLLNAPFFQRSSILSLRERETRVDNYNSIASERRNRKAISPGPRQLSRLLRVRELNDNAITRDRSYNFVRLGAN